MPVKKEGWDIKIEHKPGRGRKTAHWLVTIKRLGARKIEASYEANSKSHAGRYLAGYFLEGSSA